MKTRYDSEADALYVHLYDDAIVESEEVADGVILDFDGGGRIVGIVLAGLVPAIHVFRAARKAWMPGTIRAFTPVCDGLWPGMTSKVLDVSRPRTAGCADAPGIEAR